MTNPLEQFDEKFSGVSKFRNEDPESDYLVDAEIRDFITTHFISKQAVKEAVGKMKIKPRIGQEKRINGYNQALDDLLNVFNI